MLLLLGLVPACGSSAAAEQQSVPVLGPIEVIAPTPLPDVGLPLEQIPANVVAEQANYRTRPLLDVPKGDRQDVTLEFANRIKRA